MTMSYEEALAKHGVIGGDYLKVIEAASAEYKALVASLPSDLAQKWEQVVIGHEFFDGEIEIQLGYLQRFIAAARKADPNRCYHAETTRDCPRNHRWYGKEARHR